MDDPVVGRNGVLAQAWRALEGSETVLVEGPAGIGKTAVFRALVARARQAGWLVVSASAVESEVELPLVALADVLRPLAVHVTTLPAPQAAAVNAVLLVEASADPVEERTIGAATRSLLELAAAGGAKILVAVDDAPWLDRASERALRFALRRVSEPLAVLVTRRTEEPGAAVVPLGLDAAPRLTRVELGPLGVGSLHHVLREKLNTTFGRVVLSRVAHDSAGNPLLAIELARAVLRLPRLPRPGEDLPVSPSIHELIAGTLAGLTEESRSAVRLAALMGAPRLGELASAGVEPGAFDAAEEAGLLTVAESGVVEFAHPLHAAAVRAGIPPGVRRRLHQTLGATITDPDERARHLSLGTTGADAGVAQALAEAADRLRTRGIPDLAAELYERAADLTPDELTDATDVRGRRRLAAIRAQFDAGDYAAAAAAADAAAEILAGDLRAEALLARAILHWELDDGAAGAISAAEAALAAAGDGSLVAGRIHAHLGVFHDAMPELSRVHAHAACLALEGSEPNRDLLSGALMLLFLSEVRLGTPPRTELLERALEFEGEKPSWLAGTVPAIWWKAIDDHDRARARLRYVLDWAVTRGDEPLQNEAHTHLAECELLAGRYPAAEDHINAAIELGEQLGTGLFGETLMAAFLTLVQGDLTRAHQLGEEKLRAGAETGDTWCRKNLQLLNGLVAVHAGRMPEAAEAFAEFYATSDATGMVEPLAARYEPDWVEACVGSGDLDTAEAVIRRLEVRHARLPRPWTTLGLARSRILLAGAARTGLDAALGELAGALQSVPDDVVPLDRARCLLTAGIAHRRARRKLLAREYLSQAIAAFDVLGAVGLARRARDELARIGGRSATSTDLTPTEERVARLAVDGRTNRVIADTLFISPKTVEANLARVYRKLGISTRAQLGAALAKRGEPAE